MSYDRQLLLHGAKRNEILALDEVHAYGRDSYADADYVCPVDGSIIGEQDTRAPTSFAPVVANNTMYILEDNGRLTAWR